jgi:hypothetical protein
LQFLPRAWKGLHALGSVRSVQPSTPVKRSASQRQAFSFQTPRKNVESRESSRERRQLNGESPSVHHRRFRTGRLLSL